VHASHVGKKKYGAETKPTSGDSKKVSFGSSFGVKADVEDIQS
jgi:hypothetical protein